MTLNEAKNILIENNYVLSQQPVELIIKEVINKMISAYSLKVNSGFELNLRNARSGIPDTKPIAIEQFTIKIDNKLLTVPALVIALNKEDTIKIPGSGSNPTGEYIKSIETADASLKTLIRKSGITVGGAGVVILMARKIPLAKLPYTVKEFFTGNFKNAIRHELMHYWQTVLSDNDVDDNSYVDSIVDTYDISGLYLDHESDVEYHNRGREIDARNMQGFDYLEKMIRGEKTPEEIAKSYIKLFVDNGSKRISQDKYDRVFNRIIAIVKSLRD